MKILITGFDSYIGNNVRNKLMQYNHEVTVIDVRNNEWAEMDFSCYDTVFHVAAIVHDMKNKIPKNLYFTVNCDLPFEIAKKAKLDGVKHFIFMSTTDVYPNLPFISLSTNPKPRNLYGESKFNGEQKLKELIDKEFLVAIIRPPIVYGLGCKGNFNRLKTLSSKTFVFPKFQNQRSMIYIENLTNCVKMIIELKADGLFIPQDRDYHCTYEIVKILSNKQHKKIWFTRLGNWLIYILRKVSKTFGKVFGDSVIDQSTMPFGGKYILVDNEKAIRESI